MIRSIATAIATLCCDRGGGRGHPRQLFSGDAEGAHPHDVAPAPDGIVYYTGQAKGYLGRLDPKTGKDENIPIGSGSAPHGVIVGAGRRGLDHRWRPQRQCALRSEDQEVRLLHAAAAACRPPISTPACSTRTASTGSPARTACTAHVNPKTGKVESWKSPRGGSYGITVTPGNDVWYAALAGDHLGKIDKATGNVDIVEPHKKGAGPRRVWSDSKGVLWVSFWHSGEVGRYDPAAKSLEDVAAARQPRQRLLFGLCRRAGQGLAHRFPDQLPSSASTPRPRQFETLPEQQARRAGAPDARPARRSLGRRIRQRPAGAN